MRRRLRKKRRLGEFREYGFSVKFLTVGLTVEEGWEFLNNWIDEAIEKNGLVCGGGGKSPEWLFFVYLDRRGTATDEHRRAIEQWLRCRSEVSGFRIGKLIDAKSGWMEDDWEKQNVAPGDIVKAS